MQETHAFFPMDFGELTIDGLMDTGALSSAIPEMDLRKIRLLSPQSLIREGPPPNFQIMVANGQLETPGHETRSFQCSLKQLITNTPMF